MFGLAPVSSHQRRLPSHSIAMDTGEKKQLIDSEVTPDQPQPPDTEEAASTQEAKGDEGEYDPDQSCAGPIKADM